VVICSKTAKLIEMPFGMLSRVDPRNHVLDGGTDPRCEGVILRGEWRAPTARRQCDINCARLLLDSTVAGN